MEARMTAVVWSEPDKASGKWKAGGYIEHPGRPVLQNRDSSLFESSNDAWRSAQNWLLQVLIKERGI
jgi:hypothetical protein